MYIVYTISYEEGAFLKLIPSYESTSNKYFQLGKGAN